MSQPSSAQEIPPTNFGMPNWLLMVLPCLLCIHRMCTWQTPHMRKNPRPNYWISCIESRSSQLLHLEKGCQQQLLRKLGWPNSTCRPKIPSLLHQHSERQYEKTPKHLQSTRSFLSIQHESTIMMTTTYPPVDPPVQTHLVYPRFVELSGKSFFVSNRPFSCYLQQRYEIYFCSIWIWFFCHFGRYH